MAGKKTKRRRPRGDVHVHRERAKVYLRWTNKDGSPGRLSTHYLSSKPDEVELAYALSAQMRRDIALDNFDATLERYATQKRRRPGSKALPDLVEGFLAAKRSEGLSERTVQHDYRAAFNHLLSIKKDDISERDVQGLFRKLCESVQPSTAKRYLGRWNNLAYWAVEGGFWAQNPFNGLKAPKARRHRDRKKALIDSEIQDISRILSTKDSWDFYRDHIQALILSGLRPGEFRELRWKDIDFTHNIITVSRQAVEVPGQRGLAIKRPKSGMIRDIPMPKTLVELLRRRHTNSKKPDDLVFPGPRGKPFNPKNFERRVWNPALKAAGVRHRSLYVCRHTFASRLDEAKVPLTKIANVMGHTDLRMLIEVYLHHRGLPDEMPDLEF